MIIYIHPSLPFVCLVALVHTKLPRKKVEIITVCQLVKHCQRRLTEASCKCENLSTDKQRNLVDSKGRGKLFLSSQIQFVSIFPFSRQLKYLFLNPAFQIGVMKVQEFLAKFAGQVLVDSLEMCNGEHLEYTLVCIYY